MLILQKRVVNWEQVYALKLLGRMVEWWNVDWDNPECDRNSGRRAHRAESDPPIGTFDPMGITRYYGVGDGLRGVEVDSDQLAWESDASFEAGGDFDIVHDGRQVDRSVAADSEHAEQIGAACRKGFCEGST